jgi:hypothetical protein
MGGWGKLKCRQLGGLDQPEVIAARLHPCWIGRDRDQREARCLETVEPERARPQDVRKPRHPLPIGPLSGDERGRQVGLRPVEGESSRASCLSQPSGAAKKRCGGYDSDQAGGPWKVLHLPESHWLVTAAPARDRPPRNLGSRRTLSATASLQPVIDVGDGLTTLPGPGERPDSGGRTARLPAVLLRFGVGFTWGDAAPGPCGINALEDQVSAGQVAAPPRTGTREVRSLRPHAE